MNHKDWFLEITLTAPGQQRPVFRSAMMFMMRQPLTSLPRKECGDLMRLFRAEVSRGLVDPLFRARAKLPKLSLIPKKG